jgi:hypothetical protein
MRDSEETSFTHAQCNATLHLFYPFSHTVLSQRRPLTVTSAAERGWWRPHADLALLPLSALHSFSHSSLTAYS